MRSSWKRIGICLVVIAIIAAITLGTVACSNTPSTLSGLSAYEIAVKNGYRGTETEWLQSLSQGKSAYDIAVANGFTGTEEEWLASLQGTNGHNGTDGKDAAITISDLFEEYKAAYKESNGTDYTGTYIEFMQEYFAQTYDSISTQTMVADAVLGCVSVYSTFNITTTQYDFWGRSRGTTTQKSTSGGAGVIYWLDKANGDAYIITNYHVVYNVSADVAISEDIYVLLYGYENVYVQDGEDSVKHKYAIPATYIGGSMSLDVAVLYVHDSELLRTNEDVHAITAADSNTISIGEDAIAIGNAKGNGIAVTSGVISVDSESNTMTAADNQTVTTFRVIRVDTAINPGNSGGGLFNAYGQLIGIVHAKNTESNVDNIAYAIPANIAIYTTKGIIKRFEENGRTGTYSATKCLLGVSVRATGSHSYYDKNTKRVYIEEEVSISESVSETAAAYGHLQKDDIITNIKILSGERVVADLAVTRTFIVVDAMLLASPGDTIQVTYKRDGVTSTCSIPVTTTFEIDTIGR